MDLVKLNGFKCTNSHNHVVTLLYFCYKLQTAENLSWQMHVHNITENGGENLLADDTSTLERILSNEVVQIANHHAHESIQTMYYY